MRITLGCGTNNMAWSLKPKRFEAWGYIKDFLSVEECNKIIELGLSKQREQGSISSNIQNNIDHKIRKNNVSWLFGAPEEEWINRKLTDGIEHINKAFWNFDLEVIENLQFTIYDNLHDFYDYHMDMSMNSDNSGYRKLSISIQLSDPKLYSGSELEISINGDPVIAPKDQGTLIAFPSFVMHKVTPLLVGKRYSLVAWVHGPNWK